MEREHVFFGLMIVLVLAITGACGMDYTKSTPQERSATVFDKEHRPGYYSISCSGGKHRSCHPVWHPPTWALVYDDEQGRHREFVEEGIYSAFRAGEPVSVAFFEGAYFGIRYGTVFAHRSSGW